MNRHELDHAHKLRPARRESDQPARHAGERDNWSGDVIATEWAAAAQCAAGAGGYLSGWNGRVLGSGGSKPATGAGLPGHHLR